MPWTQLLFQVISLQAFVLISQSSEAESRFGDPVRDLQRDGHLAPMTRRYEQLAAAFESVNGKIGACMDELRRIQYSPLDSEIREHRRSVISRCNRLEQERVGRIDEMRGTIGDHSSLVFNYYDSLEKLSYRKLKRAMRTRKRDWRKIAMISGYIKHVESMKDVLMIVFADMISFGFRSQRRTNNDLQSYEGSALTSTRSGLT